MEHCCRLPSPEQELAVSHLHARYDCVPGQLLWSAVRLAELVGSKIKAYHTRLPWPFTVPVTLSSPPADGACTLCLNQYHVLVPLNALYINAAGQGSTVRTRFRILCQCRCPFLRIPRAALSKLSQAACPTPCSRYALVCSA